jgi:LPPG:FO 2-phospho-L-lactate transferase
MKLVLLSGGVGGARLARGLARIPAIDLTVVVNVGDDEVVYGLHVSPDLDTVLYTLAGIEGPDGWGRREDSFHVMGHLGSLGVDTVFRLGDADLATNLFRTLRLRQGIPLSSITAELAESLGVAGTVLPMSDDPVRTRVQIDEGWIPFQEYFVRRGHRDQVIDLRFDGAASAQPAPGVLEALRSAEAVVIGPSNPPLSVWPILAVPGIEAAVVAVGRVVGISPLFAGRALKGPAHRVLAGLGYPQGNRGVIAAYDGLLTDLVVDRGDAGETSPVAGGPTIHAEDTRIADPGAAEAFARRLVARL